MSKILCLSEWILSRLVIVACVLISLLCIYVVYDAKKVKESATVFDSLVKDVGAMSASLNGLEKLPENAVG